MLMKPQLLIIEDDPVIQNLMRNTLIQDGYAVTVAKSARHGMKLFHDAVFDCVILDLGLPDKDGVWVVTQIRNSSDIPIIIVSARAEVKDKIEALDAGADDYITKPFQADELMVRIRVLQRRMRRHEDETNLYTNRNLVVDNDAKTVSVSGQDVHVTPTEYKLLLLMVENMGKVITYQKILREVWGMYSDNIPALRVFVTTLRKKIEHYDPDNRYLQTHVGVGYRMIKYEK